jgi:hypothetical protein
MILVANIFDKKFKETVNKAVGEKYTIFERLKLKGIGSGQLKVIEYSNNLKDCFSDNHDIKFVIIELRKNGLIVYIKNYIDDYVWLIPFHQLSIFKSNFFSLHGNGTFIKIDLKSIKGNNETFFKKVQDKKLELYQTYFNI